MKKLFPAQPALAGLSLAVAATLAACAPATYNARYHRPAKPAPCNPHVYPIRNNSLLAVVNVNFTYTPKDQSGGRDALRSLILMRFNELGKPDGNSFTEPNGQQPNFYFNYSFNNDGQDHYTGSLQMSGWGEGFIHTFYRTQYSYSDGAQLAQDLTDDAYAFVHGGWKDSRDSCP